MARFRVLSPITVERGPQRTLTLLERNAILDSSECPAHWVPPPHALEPLDAEAVEMIRAGFDAARRNHGGEASVPTMGSLHHRLGGSLAHDPAKGEEARYQHLRPVRIEE